MYGNNLVTADVPGDAGGQNSGRFISNVADSRKFHRFHLWRVVRVKTPTRNQLGSDKLAKLTTLVGHHCAAKSERRRARLARAGKL